MRTIQTRTAAALLIVAGSIVPALAQGRDNGHDRGNYREDRQQQQRNSRGEDRRGGAQQFRQRDVQPQYQERQRNQPQQNYRQQQYQQQNNYNYSQQQQRNEQFRQRSVQPQYQDRGNWQQQGYRQQQYRPDNNYRGGNSYGFRSGGGMRWADRGGYQGRFIPQNRFNSLFGRQHFFRSGRPVYYNGYPQFSYGGYAFQILDPVPEYWGQNWYDSDDVYVDYEDDGYYMYNQNYPNVGIAVSINF